MVLAHGVIVFSQVPDLTKSWQKWKVRELSVTSSSWSSMPYQLEIGCTEYHINNVGIHPAMARLIMDLFAPLQVSTAEFHRTVLDLGRCWISLAAACWFSETGRRFDQDVSNTETSKSKAEQNGSRN